MNKSFLILVAILLFQQTAFSLTGVKGVTVAYLQSTNSNNLKQWYNDKIGLNITNVPEVPGWNRAQFQNGTVFGIQSVKDQIGSRRQALMVVIEVMDIEQAVSELTRRGVRFEIPQGKISPVIAQGSVKIATLQDPDGNYLQMLQVLAKPNGPGR